MHFDPDLHSCKSINFGTLEFGRTALIERYHETEFIYGRWDIIFGAWRRVGGRTSEFVPKFGFIPREKVDCTPRSPQFLATLWQETLSSTQSEADDVAFRRELASLKAIINELERGFWLECFECGSETEELPAAVKDYMELIPEEVRAITASMESYQWLALEACWEYPAFLEWLERSGWNRRYTAAVWALTAAWTTSRQERRKLHQSIHTERPDRLMKRLLPAHTGSALLTLLGKVQVGVLSERHLRLLRDLASSPAAIRCLRHVSTLPLGILEALASLPPPLMRPDAVAGLARGAQAAPDFLRMLSENAGRIDGPARASVLALLPKVGKPSDLMALMERIRARIEESRPFPRPPLHSYPKLEPIRSRARLRKEGAAMKNCCAGYLDMILEGHGYFYHWHGAEPATVCIVQALTGTWIVHECRAFDDEVPSLRTRRAIRRAIARSQPRA